MKHIFEVKEYYFDYAQEQRLYEKYEDAEKDFNDRVKNFSETLRMVTNPEEIKEEGYTTNIVIWDRHDSNPNNLKQARLIHYPPQLEVEGEPLHVGCVQIDIVRKELL